MTCWSIQVAGQYAAPHQNCDKCHQKIHVYERFYQWLPDGKGLDYPHPPFSYRHDYCGDPCMEAAA